MKSKLKYVTLLGNENGVSIQEINPEGKNTFFPKRKRRFFIRNKESLEPAWLQNNN